MNQYLVIFAVLFAVGVVHCEISVTGLNAKQLEDLEDAELEKCRAQLNVDKSVIEEFNKQETGVPSSVEFQKVLGCFGQNMGYNNGLKINWDKVKVVTEIYHHESVDELKKALNIVEECKVHDTHQHADVNQLNYEVTKCFKEGYQKAKLEW